MAGRAEQLDRLLGRLENFVAALALALAVTLSVAGVILRYLFDYVIFWSQEATIFLIILSTFVGASIALRHKDHVGVDLLAQVLRGRARQAVAVLSILIVAVYAGLIGVLAWSMVSSQESASFRTASLDLPLWVPQLAVPIGLTLLLIRSLQILYRTVRGRDPYPDASADAVPEERA